MLTEKHIQRLRKGLTIYHKINHVIHKQKYKNNAPNNNIRSKNNLQNVIRQINFTNNRNLCQK